MGLSSARRKRACAIDRKDPAAGCNADPAHSTFMFKVSHLGFWNFTVWFETFSADLRLDPAKSVRRGACASADLASLTVHAPPAGFQDELRGEQYLDAKQFHRSVQIHRHQDERTEHRGSDRRPDRSMASPSR